MHVTVFGAAGWLGRAVLKNLTGRHAVRAVDRDPAAWRKYDDLDGTWDEGQILHLDIRDHDAVSAALEGTDAILHLTAAFPGSPEEASAGFGVNLHGLWNVLECARQRGTRRIVHMGSAGNVHPAGIFFEADVRRPDASLYTVTKRLQEEMCRQFHEAHDLRIIVLRAAMIVDAGLGITRDRIRLDGMPTEDMVCRHDLAEACRLSLESQEIDFDILHIVGSTARDATCNAARARRVLRFEPKKQLPR